MKWLVGMHLLLLSWTVGAQISIHQGKDFPRDPKLYDWHVDTVQHQLWQWRERWTLKEPAADSVTACWSMVRLKTPAGIQMYDHIGLVLTQAPIVDCQCEDSVVVIHTGRRRFGSQEVVAGRPQIFFFDYKGALLKYFENYGNYVLEVEWKGRPAWCIPDYQPHNGSRLIFRESLHNWGIYGGKGRWLISPIYDAPFSFENGQAKVLYYGRQLQIDEDGREVK